MAAKECYSSPNEATLCDRSRGLAIAPLQRPNTPARDDPVRVIWTRREINAYVDNVLYFTFKNERLTDPHKADWRQWPFHQDFRLLLNIAVAGNWGGQKGIDDSIWPQRMAVDYVRVMQLK